MGERKPLMKDLKVFFQEVSKKINLQKAILFGSMAEGRAGPASDYDLIVISKDFEGKKSYKRPSMLYLYWNIDAPVDFICLTPEEFKEKAGRITIVKHAVQNGIEVA